MKQSDKEPLPKGTLNERYIRVNQNVNFDEMMNTVIFWVGTGASGSAIEQLTRLGIKRLHLSDNKLVRRKNMVAQNFRHSDIGIPKTEALKKRLKQCEFEKGNPDITPIKIYTHGDFLAITDRQIRRIIKKEKSKGRRVVFVMSSDYHPVQAGGNRIALKYGVAVFWVGIYRMGKAGEIIFYVPGHDLPCYRCIAETRYQFFDTNRLADHLMGIGNGAGRSSGLPMAATFIDAVLLHLIIGYIHLNIDQNQHSRLFRQLLVEKRNFIQCQLDSEYRLNESEDIFAQVTRSMVEHRKGPFHPFGF